MFIYIYGFQSFGDDGLIEFEDKEESLIKI